MLLIVINSLSNNYYYRVKHVGDNEMADDYKNDILETRKRTRHMYQVD